LPAVAIITTATTPPPSSPSTHNSSCSSSTHRQLLSHCCRGRHSAPSPCCPRSFVHRCIFVRWC
jgi:hypothetical protein